MLKFTKKYLWSVVMCWGFTLAGWSVFTWQFYVATLPVFLLVQLRDV